MTHSANSGQATGFALPPGKGRGSPRAFTTPLVVFARHELNLKLSEDQRRLTEFLQDVENRRAHEYRQAEGGVKTLCGHCWRCGRPPPWPTC